MARHRIRARYVELTLDDDDQTQELLEAGVVVARTQDNEQVQFEKDLLQAAYVPIAETTVDFGEGL